MAGLKRKYKGVMLLESLVAMAIILTCVGIATTIFVNVMSSNNIRLRLSAYNTLKKIAYQSIKKNELIDETIKTGALTINKRVTVYESNSSIIILKLKAIDNNKTVVASYNEVIIK